MAICFWLKNPKATTLYIISFLFASTNESHLWRQKEKDATAIVIANTKRKICKNNVNLLLISVIKSIIYRFLE